MSTSTSCKQEGLARDIEDGGPLWKVKWVLHVDIDWRKVIINNPSMRKHGTRKQIKNVQVHCSWYTWYHTSY